MKLSNIICIIFLIIFHLTALHLAIQNENLEIVKLLLENEKIDVNEKSILQSIIIHII